MRNALMCLAAAAASLGTCPAWPCLAADFQPVSAPGAAPAADQVPSPAQTPVELTISGRTSTLGSITVEAVGQAIPRTFSGDLLKNAPGFSWYVSRHYALQTDYDPARARHLLTLLELAYPHYVELFGRELPDLDTTRMAVIYGASTQSLRTSLEADGIAWDFGGGGITYERFNAAFNYPSGSLQYHQRYIMLHECAHLYQMCLNGTTMTTPPWYYEGIADAVAHHVWDDEHQRLTMAVVDKPTVNNWYDAGLEQYAANPFTASDILKGRRGGRDLGFLLVNYFNTDLDRSMRFEIWRDELFRLNLYGTHQAESDRLIEELFGADRLDEDFARWLGRRTSTYHYVDWGWEQDADTMISYGWPQTGAYSQTDLRTPPGSAPTADPLVMDFPRRPMSPLVEAPRRGVDEPVVSCLVGFIHNPDSGVAGMALGVEGRAFLKVLIAERRRLLLDASDIGGDKVELAFSEAFVRSEAPAMEIGLTMRIGKDALEVTARTGNGAESQAARLPLSPQLRERILTRPMAVLSRDGRHRLTPYVDDGPTAEPDLARPAPSNRWRSSSLGELRAVYRATWRLGGSAPASLIALRERMLNEAQGSDPSAAAASLRAARAQVETEIRSCGAAPEAIDRALTELRAAGS